MNAFFSYQQINEARNNKERYLGMKSWVIWNDLNNYIDVWAYVHVQVHVTAKDWSPELFSIASFLVFWDRVSHPNQHHGFTYAGWPASSRGCRHVPLGSAFYVGGKAPNSGPSAFAGKGFCGGDIWDGTEGSLITKSKLALNFWAFRCYGGGMDYHAWLYIDL